MTLHRRCASLAAIALALTAAHPAAAQLRIVNYNVAQLDGNTASLQDVLAALNDDDKPGFAVAPWVYVMQEVRSGDQTAILNMLNTVAPEGIDYVLGTFTITAAENSTAGAQALFFRDDKLFEIPSQHLDIPTGASRNADRWKLQLKDYDSLAASFFIYSMHLKAGSASSDEDERETGALAVRADADSLPDGTRIIYAGDFNLSSNTEGAYQAFIAPGVAQAIDPLGNGSWTGSGYAVKHTQAPCSSGCGPLIGGGMDDRFDFQISVFEMQDTNGLSYIFGTYRALGNDGFHYNQAINNGNNFYYPGDLARSNALADDLFEASDHVPVVADYRIPAVFGAELPADYGRVIQGADFEVEVLVTNDADVVVPAGADVLHYTVTGLAGFTGWGTGDAQAQSPPQVVPLAVNTSATGLVQGIALLTSSSQAVQIDSMFLPSVGTVVRPANASFASDNDLDQHTVVAEFDPDTGVQVLDVEVYNFGFDDLQALLDIDAVTEPAGPFSFAGGLTSGIADLPALLSFDFDTTGLGPGEYIADITIDVSDEDLPGESLSAIDLTLDITIMGNSADLNDDGSVGAEDLAMLLGSWGPCPPEGGCPADLDGDGSVGAADLAMLLGAWG